MSFKLVRDTLKEVTSLLSVDATYMTLRKQTINITPEKKFTSLVCLYRLNRATEIAESYVKRYQVGLLFVQRSQFKEGEDEHVQIQDVQEVTQDEFIQKLDIHDNVELISNLNTNLIYNWGDQNLSGVECTFNLTVYSNDNYCKR